jgi:hypothetical protein
MKDMMVRVWDQLIGRVYGPLTFRLILQPSVAIFFAIRSGLRDAREGRPLFFWALALDSTQRTSLFRHGWQDVGKLFVVAAILDVIYQVAVFKWVYAGQVLIVAVVLAIVPYLAVRGLTNRIGRWFIRKDGNG